jgi:TrmH family RNA methyltransferase
MQSKLFSSLQFINTRIMISRTKAKLVRSLALKKFRQREGLFVAEGDKLVGELLRASRDSGTRITEILATGSWLERNAERVRSAGISVCEADETELRKVSTLVNPQQVLALVTLPAQEPDPGILAGVTVLGLEAVRDPGNLGTIVRTADWFGIRHMVCSTDSVDLFNPKVVQATMGAVARVRVYYTRLEALLAAPALQQKAVYGTYPRGENIYETGMEAHPLILFGNESRGLSPALDPYITTRLSIPSFAGEGMGSESLNLASSVAVVCSEYRRRITRSES